MVAGETHGNVLRARQQRLGAAWPKKELNNDAHKLQMTRAMTNDFKEHDIHTNTINNNCIIVIV